MKKYRCAIYTRKSTEDGLEQDFNSLDAQREACEAYVKSQQHEGWKLLPAMYDDGGISGGTMERPALKRLLDEVRAGRVDIIVVYKVDRLTRALADFAKMVDIFDEHDVSFVSITQQFNTTTSMGRLTLNVLLSFAQFEREVTAERIRDKIAASKKKGMWMGGPTPLGYDVVDKKLVVNVDEAETVKLMFSLYLKLGNVRRLREEVIRQGIKTKIRTYKDGRVVGGDKFSRGRLYQILKNQTYIGRVMHKGESYDGMQDSIIDDEMWGKVQAQLKRNASDRHSGKNVKSPSLLTGLLFDDKGRRLTTSHTKSKGKILRYYIAATDEYGKPQPDWRLPAKEVESVVVDGLRDQLSNKALMASLLSKDVNTPKNIETVMETALSRMLGLESNIVHEQKLTIQKLVSRVEINKKQVRVYMTSNSLLAQLEHDVEVKDHIFDIPVIFRNRAHGEKLIIASGIGRQRNFDHQLIKAVSQGYVWFEQLRLGEFKTVREIALANDTNEENVTQILRFAFLSPFVVVTILNGQQPVSLNARKLKRFTDLPMNWKQHEDVLNFV